MKITTGFLTGNVIVDDTNLDVPATAAEYARLLTMSIQNAYPRANVSVDWQDAGGCVPHSLQTAVHGAPDYKQELVIIDHVESIKNSVFSDGKFYITA